MNSPEIFCIFSILNDTGANTSKELRNKAIKYFKKLIKAQCCGSCKHYSRILNFCRQHEKMTERECNCSFWDTIN